MDRGQLDVLELSRAFRASRRNAHVQALFDNASQRLLHARVTVGPRPPDWQARTWRYETHTFVAARTRAGQFSKWIDAADDTEIDFADGVWIVPAVHARTNWSRRAGQTPGNVLPWPVRDYTLHAVDRPDSPVTNEFLVGGSSPSFPTLGSAFRAFFDGNYRTTGSQEPQNGELHVRVVDDSAWFGRVRLARGFVEATVRGRPGPGTLLELNSATVRETVAVEKVGRFRFDLPDGTPDDAWLWLKRDDDWLDYRALSGWSTHAAGVDVDIEPDSPLQLDELVREGEGPRLEFKRELPQQPEQKRGVFKTVAAFANGAGGTLLFGIADDGEVVGVPGPKAHLYDQVTNLVRDLIDPMPSVTTTLGKVGDRHVIRLDVASGDGQLYALTVHKNRPEYFVRHGATTFYARPEELRHLASDRGRNGAASFLQPTY